jgi:hypothetical protein
MRQQKEREEREEEDLELSRHFQAVGPDGMLLGSSLRLAERTGSSAKRLHKMHTVSSPLRILDPASVSMVLIDRLTMAFIYKGPPDPGLSV